MQGLFLNGSKVCNVVVIVMLTFFLISQALEELHQNNEYELQQLKTELIEKHEKEMQELKDELEKAQSEEMTAARKSGMESRANFTMSMDSLDAEVHEQV